MLINHSAFTLINFEDGPRTKRSQALDQFGETRLELLDDGGKYRVIYVSPGTTEEGLLESELFASECPHEAATAYSRKYRRFVERRLGTFH